jgi:hypothetical protein
MSLLRRWPVLGPIAVVAHLLLRTIPSMGRGGRSGRPEGLTSSQRENVKHEANRSPVRGAVVKPRRPPAGGNECEGG